MTRISRRTFVSSWLAILSPSFGTIQSVEGTSSDPAFSQDFHDLQAEHFCVLGLIKEHQDDYEIGLPTAVLADLVSQISVEQLDDALIDLKRAGVIYERRTERLRVVPKAPLP